MGRIRFIVIGAIVGIAWAASLRGFMQELAGPDSRFTFTGTFAIIIPTGTIVGALLGWAEYQHRIGHQYRLLILAPLLIGVVPDLATATPDPAPIGLALLAMAGGYAVCGRGPLWTRIGAGIVNLAGVAVTFVAPKPSAELSAATPHGLWFATLGASLGAVLALACAIPMRRPDPWLPRPSPLGRPPRRAGRGGRAALPPPPDVHGVAHLPARRHSRSRSSLSRFGSYSAPS